MAASLSPWSTRNWASKSVFGDRMVLLYEDMKDRNPGYAAWER